MDEIEGYIYQTFAVAEFENVFVDSLVNIYNDQNLVFNQDKIFGLEYEIFGAYRRIFIGEEIRVQIRFTKYSDYYKYEEDFHDERPQYHTLCIQPNGDIRIRDFEIWDYEDDDGETWTDIVPDMTLTSDFAG